jgi:2,4-dienoyl-CoA reductase-like NADH-dependent reductase (Old Yellow Enzyme family)/thioredoxin reductase
VIDPTTALFQPLRLGPVELRNRIVSTAHQTTLVTDHLPTAAFVAYHEERARGGVGLIVLEATAPHPAGLLTDHELAGYLPEIVPAYRSVASAVQPHGTKLFVQLLDGGREQISGAPRMPALAPSPIPSQRYRSAPRALRADEIEEIVAGFAASAALAAEAGLDGVEISGAHRYLVAQFFDPDLNLRDDEWGEPSRFLLEVVRAVRTAAPGLALGVRLSADAPPAVAVAPLLAGEVDYLSLALGDASSYLGSTLIVPPPPLDDTLIERHLAGFRIGLPLIATSRVFDPAEAGRLVDSGAADAVGMTRALIVDPDMPRKARDGRHDEIVRCIGCQACIAHYHAGEPIRCAVNPRTGRELTWPYAVAASSRLRVVVVGAGPAGLAAAAEAIAAGHEVTVLERGAQVGGQQALATVSPGGAPIARGVLANARRTLDAVDLRLGVAATADTVVELTPDAVVVATGAAPYSPALPLDGMPVAQAWDVLAGHASPRGSVVLADWGGDPLGVSAAETLAAAGCSVTLCVASVAFGEALHQYRRNLALQRLYRAGVVIRMHLELTGASREGATFRNAFAPELKDVVEADWLVLALGRVPVDTLAPRLRQHGLRVEEAGDCLSPRTLEEAILEGAVAVRRLATPVA